MKYIINHLIKDTVDTIYDYNINERETLDDLSLMVNED